MIRLLAPRCAERRDAPSFRVLLCRAHPGQAWCGKSWTANGEARVIEALAERETHEGECLGGDITQALRDALPG